MGDMGCKYQTQHPPADEEVRRNITAVGKLLLPKNPLKRDLRELLETLHPEVECRSKMRKTILNELKSDSKPGRTGTTCCIELQNDHERWLSELPFTVDGVLHCYINELRYFHDKADFPGSKSYLAQIRHQKLTFKSFFYPGAFRPLKDVDRISDDIEEIRRLLGTHKSEPGWNLPRTHRFHLLNFPKEILKMIFAYTLVAKGGAFVAPTVVTSNYCESYSEADYRISFPESPYYNGYKSFESGSEVTLRKNVGPRPGFPDSAPFKMKGDSMKPYDSPSSLLSEDSNYHWPNPDKPILSQEGPRGDLRRFCGQKNVG
ncbi:hypothetical protein BTUL_0011g00960 [Botrytis tulipae]|uniref:Uncharacterized protein n=1 Tax=Botrytis tulipae TaxID=87230 RepID=A0A4Z1F407_9HELO|nr:hypothetical protein BTUL_0011g00960 [Botrytis tulipae]